MGQARTFWRLLDTGSHDGAFNMAVDEALAKHPQQVPVLRTYCWRPPTVSLGFHQKSDNLDLEACRRHGIGIVRRPTGGRAVLHCHEVTYSVTIPRHHDWYGLNPSEVYNFISLAIVTGLKELDPLIALERVGVPDAGELALQTHFACFATSARHEIHHNGRKLVGSAQRRFKNGLLQHGSILLGNQHRELAKLVRTPETVASVQQGGGWMEPSTSSATKSLADRTISLEEIVKRPLNYREVAGLLRRGFESAFGITFIEEGLSETELDLSRKLRVKYLATGGYHER